MLALAKNNGYRPLFIDLVRLITSPLEALANIHHAHGDFVQTKFFNKDLVFVSKPESFEEIFSLEAKGLLNRDSMYNAKKPVFGDSIFNSRGDTWTSQRRLMQPLFTKEAVTGWQGIFVEESAAFTKRLTGDGSAQINISKEVKLLVQSVIIRVLFGRQGKQNKDIELIESIDTIVAGVFFALVTEVLGKGRLSLLFVPQNRRMKKAVARFVAYVYDEIDRNNEAFNHNLITLMADAKDKNTGYAMTKELLKDEAVTMFLGGQDTTINTLVWFFYMMGLNPKAQDKIINEVMSFKDDEITAANLAKLSYTRAALNETLRLYPQATGLSRDVANDIMIGGHPVNKGASVVLSIYVTHRNPGIWKKPNDFYPEHFLGQQEGYRHKFGFLPFGAGIHNCIGRHLAELEMLTVITTFYRSMKITGVNNLNEKVSFSLKPDKDLTATVSKI
jgi:enediyne biosynthesis protein E7